MKINYVLLTAARNEEKYIEKLIESIIGQNILPNKWVIISDGSTDKTNEIVKRYEKKYDFINLLIKENVSGRNFSSKVHALQSGFNELKDIKYDFIGNLDADISFEPDYFERIFKKFNHNQKLGIAGGWIYELKKGIYCARFGNNVLNVPGAIQMFKRKCYEEIDGYLPSKLGGEDTIAEVMAKMNGWEVKSFTDIKVLHHRPTGTGQSNKHIANFRFGVLSYSIGYDPFFLVARCVSRLGVRPYVIGSLFTMIGYVFAFIRKENRVVSDEFVKYYRNEQRQRLRKAFSKFLGFIS
jgi:glycosyltransferase involved in cell wall biosynthesis